MHASCGICRVLILTLGVTLMAATSEEANAQDKKDARKETKLKITVKSWDAAGKQFLKPQEGVDARKLENKGLVIFFVPVKQAIGRGQPRTGSEITEPDGTVWVVTRGSSTGMGEFDAEVKKKPVEKKP